MKRKGFLKDQVLSLDNLYLAFCKAAKGKQRKREVLLFAEHFDDNILSLRRRLDQGSMPMGRYHFFTIRDPKVRIISAAPFSERVVHHALMNVCHPFFDATLIDDTYATRKGKGLYQALNRAVGAMSHYPYCVKLDVRKYYDSIDHVVLKSRLRRLFKDQWLLALFDKIIDGYSVLPGRGLPIGNLTSQYFANFYLSDLDHMAKELWHAQAYIRYMDDILVAGDDLMALHACVDAMSVYLSNTLHLAFKPPIYRPTKDGQTFLGYRVLPFHCRLSGRSKRRFRSKLMLYDALFSSGKWSESQYQEHLLPLTAFVRHAACKPFCTDCLHIIEGANREVLPTA